MFTYVRSKHDYQTTHATHLKLNSNSNSGQICVEEYNFKNLFTILTKLKIHKISFLSSSVLPEVTVCGYEYVHFIN